MNYSELLQLAKGWGNFISGRIIIWRLLYYSEAVGKIEMYLLCQKYHMSGCVQYEPTNEMMVELYGEERKIDNFMPVLEKYFNRKPCKVIEMNGEPDYGVGDFRIG